MKKKIYGFLTLILMVSLLIPIPVKADTGPKPSVRITFENMGDELCYGTLLSLRESTGPQSAWDGDEEHIYNYDLDIDIWRSFVEYKDADGYYFLQIAWQCHESKTLNWTYYPPSNFKVLLYYPESNTFQVSDVCERYAFDSYFTVRLNADGRTLDVEKSYDYTGEIASFLCRVVFTLLVELALAWIFGFRDKKVFGAIAIINIITQIGLNIALSLTIYQNGYLSFIFEYVVYEFGIFVTEAILYVIVLQALNQKNISKLKAIIYALVANVLSFVLGMVIATYIPALF